MTIILEDNKGFRKEMFGYAVQCVIQVPANTNVSGICFTDDFPKLTQDETITFMFKKWLDEDRMVALFTQT